VHGRMAPIMSHFSLEQGLLGCCSSCHTVFGDELTGKSFGSRERHFPFTGSRSVPLPAAVASARGGDERADWTPRAALASGHPPMGASPRTMLATPPPSLLVDIPSGRRPATPPARDPAAKAVERARLRKLVNDFSQEASAGRPCFIIVLDGNVVGSFGPRREARYILSTEVDRLSLDWKTQVCSENNTEVDADAEWEPIGMWPLEAVLGTHRAEESALVQSRQRELSRLVSREELSRAAVLEFSGGGLAARKPLLLIEETPEHRERFVSGMQILRLYKGAAQRLESARSAGDKRPYAMPNGLLSSSPVVSPVANSHEGVGGTDELDADGLIARKV